MALTSSAPQRDPAYHLGAATLFAATAIILLALAFQYIGGYKPCPLCLEQRYAYYAGIPLLFLGLVLLSMGRAALAAAIFVLVGIGFLGNAGLAGYHAGVEWKLWEGPQTCSGAMEPLGSASGGLLKQLQQETFVRCDEAAWRLAGLSFAGWNAILCVLLALGCFRAAGATRAPA
jgi:disulfide bond formation protein DsbB